jgi:hypothetical protein
MEHNDAMQHDGHEDLGNNHGHPDTFEAEAEHKREQNTQWNVQNPVSDEIELHGFFL